MFVSFGQKMSSQESKIGGIFYTVTKAHLWQVESTTGEATEPKACFFYAMSGNANSNFSLWQLKRQELWWEMVEGSLHLKQIPIFTLVSADYQTILHFGCCLQDYFEFSSQLHHSRRLFWLAGRRLLRSLSFTSECEWQTLIFHVNMKIVPFVTDVIISDLQVLLHRLSSLLLLPTLFISILNSSLWKRGVSGRSTHFL